MFNHFCIYHFCTSSKILKLAWIIINTNIKYQINVCLIVEGEEYVLRSGSDKMVHQDNSSICPPKTPIRKCFITSFLLVPSDKAGQNITSCNQVWNWFSHLLITKFWLTFHKKISFYRRKNYISIYFLFVLLTWCMIMILILNNWIWRHNLITRKLWKLWQST